MKTEFIKPRLVGRRFDEHTIPVEVLKDWVAFEGLIIDTARWLYLKENPDRRRAPRGFADGFSLNLSRVGEGSATLTLEHIYSGFFPDENFEWFKKALNIVLDVVRAASEGKDIDPSFFPNKLLSYFDPFGRSLRENERIEFPGHENMPAVYDIQARKNLVLRTASEYRTEEQLRGSISQLNAENSTLTFKFIDGHKVVGTYSKEVRSQAIGALDSYGESLVLIDAIVVRDQFDQPKNIENISRVEFLDPLDITARIEELSLLRDGWLDGDGVVPSKDRLAQFVQNWSTHWPNHLPLPYLYPTPVGGLQAEWSSNAISTSAETDPACRVANLLVVRNDTGDIEYEATLDLDTDSGWETLEQWVEKNHLSSIS